MPWGDPRTARLAAAAGALSTVVLLQVIRVWLPSLGIVPGGPAANGLGIAAAGGACLAVPLVAARRLGGHRAGEVLAGGGTALVLARVLLQASPGGWPQLVTATAGVLAGVLALSAWATRVDGHAGRLAVLLGVMTESILHLAHGTLDLVWRPGPGAIAGTLALAAATLVTTLLAGLGAREPVTADGSDRDAAAWPWLALGPATALVLLVSAASGRAAVATTWSTTTVAAVLAGAHALAVVAALAGPRLGAVRCGTLGAGLVLLGTAGALRPVGALAVLAQVGLALGIGLAVGALARVRRRPGPARTATAVAGAWLLTGLVVLGFPAGERLAAGWDTRYLLVLAATLLAVLALAGARRAAPSLGAAPGRGPLLAAVAAATVATLAAAAAAPAPPDAPRPATPGGDAVTLALLNVQSGYDERGRFGPRAQADALRALGPDLVVLNEVDRGWPLTGGHDTLRLLSGRIGLTPRFAPAGDHLRGDAVLTDLPAGDTNRIRLPRGPGSGGEGLLSVVVAVRDDRHLAVLATQLHPVEAHADVRRRQARVVAAEVARLRGQGLEVVVLGDLRAEPQAPELEPLEDLLAHALPAGRGTWPAGRPRRRLDHVLVSEGLEVLGAEVGEAEVSDHRPVRVRLRLPEPAAAAD